MSDERRSLAPVLEPVASGTAPDGPAARIFALDRETGRAVVAGSIWTRLGRYLHVRVRNQSDPGAVVRDQRAVELGGWAEGPPVTLDIRYEASCPAGAERRVAEGLGTLASPRAGLHQRLELWVRDLTDEAISRDRPIDLGILARSISGRAEADLGLAFVVKEIGLRGAADLRTHVLGPKKIAVRMEDHGARFELDAELELAPDPQAPLRCLRHADRLSRLDQEIEDEIVRFFAAEVSLHAYHAELSAVVVPALRRRVQTVAERYGRTVARIHLASGSAVAAATHVEVQHQFDCSIPQRERKIQFQASALLELVDVGAYLRAGSPALDPWARTQLEHATRARMYATNDLEDLLTGFERGRADIRAEMARRAIAIGYQIIQLVTATDLQVHELLVPFQVEVDGLYANQTPNAHAGLKTVVKLRISAFNQLLLSLLTREVDVKASIRDTLRDDVGLGMLEATAEDFYLYFRSPRPRTDREPDRGDEPRRRAPTAPATLEGRLHHRVTRMLRDTFGAEVLQVTFAPTDTEITRRLDELRRRLHAFVVRVEPRGVSLPLEFDGTMIVDGIDPRGWANFLTRRPSVDEVTSTLTRALAARLAEVDPSQLRTMASEALREHINAWSLEHLGELYGLVVRVTDWAPRRDLDAEGRARVLEETVRERWDAASSEGRQRAEVHALRLTTETARVRALGQELENIDKYLASQGPAFDSPEDRARYVTRRAEILEQLRQQTTVDYGRLLTEQGAAELAPRARPEAADAFTPKRLEARKKPDA